MSTVLYRKYRPRTFAEVKDQNHIKITLQNEIATMKLAHAYLFCGPRGVAKTTLARVLARAINCEERPDGESEPCNECRSCRDILEGRSLDVVEMDAASHTGVDNVRDNIINDVRFTPSSSKYKIFIIDEVHMLSISAFNALLKTLEEPPAHTLFILVTTEAHKIPATIISRCQRFDFKKINNAELLKALEEIVIKEERQVDQAVLLNIARHADGCLRDALSLLGQILSLDGKIITESQASLVLPPSDLGLNLKFIELILKRDLNQVLDLIHRIADDGVDFNIFVRDVVELSRQVILLKIASDTLIFREVLEESMIVRIREMVAEISPARLLKLTKLLINALEEIKKSPIIELPLELLVIEFINDSAASGINSSFSASPASIFSRENIKREEGLNQNIIAAHPELAAEKVPSPTSAVDIAVAPMNNGAVELSNAAAKWPDIVKKIVAEQQSLGVVLSLGKPLNINGNKIQVGFQYPIHSEKVNDFKNKELISRVLKEVFGLDMILEAIISDEVKIAVSDNNHKTGDEAIDRLIDDFGGQVVS